MVYMVGFNSNTRGFCPWWGFEMFSVYSILGKNVLKNDWSHLLAFKIEKWRMPKVVPLFSESENPSVLLAWQLISGCIIHRKRVPFFNPGGVALPSLSAVSLKGWWSRLWVAVVFTEGYQHGQVLHAVIYLQASGGELMQSGSFRLWH